MRKERKRFKEEHLNWRAWNADSDTAPVEPEISPVLRKTVLAMRDGIQQAIADAEHAKAPSYEIIQGKLLTTIGGRSTYQFRLIKDADLEDQTAVNAMIPGHEREERKIEARVVSKMELEIRLSTREPLPEEQLARLILVEDKTWLLKRQLRALEHIRETEAQLGAKTLGLLPTRSGVEVVRQLGTFVPNDSQKQAIAHGLGSERTFIVGPGGTGKTVTASNLICRYLDQGLSVLLVSHTNIATDNAFLDVVYALSTSNKPELRRLIKQELIVRQGTPHHLELLKGESRRLTVEALAEQRMGAQAKERKQAEETHQALLQQIEHLEHEIHQRESEWLLQREEFEQKTKLSPRPLLRLQKKKEARIGEQQKASDLKSKAQLIQQKQNLQIQKVLKNGEASLKACQIQLEQ